MRYFEFKNPFLATIKAENKEDAIDTYIKEVVGGEEEKIYDIKEIDKYTAFVKLIRANKKEKWILKKLSRILKAKIVIYC